MRDIEASEEDHSSDEMSEMNNNDLHSSEYSEEEKGINWGDNKHKYYKDNESGSEDQDLQEDEIKHRLQEEQINLDDIYQQEESDEEQSDAEINEEDKDVFLDKRMPEMVGLLKEYMALQKFIKKANGVNDQYVQMKMSMAKQYQADILYYILVKENNQDVRDHPIIQSLVEKKENLNKINKIGKNYEKTVFEKIKQQKMVIEEQKEQQSTIKTQKVEQKKEKKQKMTNNDNERKEEEENMKDIYQQMYDEDEEYRFNKNKNIEMDMEEDYSGDSQLDSFDDQEEQQMLNNKADSKKQLKKITKNDEVYDNIKKQKEQKKSSIKEQQVQEDVKHFNQMGLDEKEGTRKVTREILKNKGLVRNRRKDKRNSRVKHKKKYEKALIKQKSLQNYVRINKGGYGGEKTGIKSHIVKSVNLKAT